MHAGFGFGSTFSLEPIVQDDLRVFAWERSSQEPLGKQSLNGSQFEIIRGLGSRPAHGKEDRLVADEGGVAEALGTFPVRAEERNPRTVVSMENDCGLLKEADRLQVLQEIAKRPVETA